MKKYLIIALLCIQVVDLSAAPEPFAVESGKNEVRQERNKRGRGNRGQKDIQNEEMSALPVNDEADKRVVDKGQDEMRALPVKGSGVTPEVEMTTFDGGSSEDQAWVDALEGYRRFTKQYPPNSALIRALAQGQQPQIMVVGCSDSRVDPALLLQTRPGDLFMVRNVANIVPAYTQDSCRHGVGAALEYGIRENFLNVGHLVLFGHSSCGGIKGLLTGIKDDTFITSWIDQVKAALPEEYKPKAKVTDLEIDTCAQAALKVSYKNCMSYPFIADKVKSGKLVIHVWFFDIGAGKILMLSKDKEEQPWEPLDDEVLNRFLEKKRVGRGTAGRNGRGEMRAMRRKE